MITARKNRDTNERDREESYQKKAIKKNTKLTYVFMKKTMTNKMQ